MKELLLRTLTGILLIVLVAGAIFLGYLPFLGILMLVYILGIRELFTLYHISRSVQQWIIAVSGSLLFPLTLAVVQYQWNPLVLLIPFVLWGIGATGPGFSRAYTLSLFWLAIPLSCFFALGWHITDQVYDHWIPLSVISLVWINDTFAYVTGSLLGRHKMAPRLSPGKTWEGFAGGIMFTMLGSWVSYRINGEYSLRIWLIFALVISSLSLWGDLFESGIKRKKKVKNSGEILPGHGGILDRFDSLFFVAPGIMVLLIILKLVQ